VNESSDISEAMIDQEKFSVVNLILQNFPEKSKKTLESTTPADVVGMGTGHAEKQRELARFRRATDDQEMEKTDLLNMLGSPGDS